MEFNLQKLCENIVIEENRKNRYYSILDGFADSNVIYSLIKYAIDKYKKEDRIVWYLRWRKLNFINKIIENESNNPEIHEKAKSWKKKFFQKTLKENKDYVSESELEKFLNNFNSKDISNLETNIDHFLSLPIEEIQKYEFGWKIPDKIYNDFEKIEKEWKDAKGEDDKWINITDELGENIEIVHKFEDGFYWLDLKREYCELEADSMGHCGNKANPQKGDTVLSLRKIKKINDQIFSRPSLTFILDKDGFLGEMKGRDNNKPHKKYHSHIIKLLKIKKNGEFLVRDVVGGGHSPEDNFSLYDLSEEDKKDLFGVRLDLKPSILINREDGFTDVLIDRIRSLPGFLSIQEKNNSVLFHGFDDVDGLLQEYENMNETPNIYNMRKYIDNIDDIFDFHMSGAISKDELKELYTSITYKHSEVEKEIKKYIHKKYNDNDIQKYEMDEGSLDSDTNQFYFLYEFDDEIIRLLEDSMRVGYVTGTEERVLKYYEKQILNLQIENEYDNISYDVGLENGLFNKVYYVITIMESLELVDIPEIKKIDFKNLTEYLNETEGMLKNDADEVYDFEDLNEESAIEYFMEMIYDTIGNSNLNEKIINSKSTEYYLNYF